MTFFICHEDEDDGSHKILCCECCHEPIEFETEKDAEKWLVRHFQRLRENVAYEIVQADRAQLKLVRTLH